MKKRMTDVDIWNLEWFMELDPTTKCFVKYVFDKADNSGVWSPNYKLAGFQIGGLVSEEMLTRVEDGRHFEVLPNGNVFIPDFIIFQAGTNLSTKVGAHRNIIGLIAKNGLEEKLKGKVTINGAPINAEEMPLEDEPEFSSGSLPVKNALREHRFMTMAKEFLFDDYKKYRPDMKYDGCFHSIERKINNVISDQQSIHPSEISPETTVEFFRLMINGLDDWKKSKQFSPNYWDKDFDANLNGMKFTPTEKKKTSAESKMDSNLSQLASI